jgi:hypothetical protein
MGAIFGESTLLPKPTEYPTSMARYGLNTYGEPKYRVVYGPSVKMIVGGAFADGYTGYRFRRAYQVKGWILEKWLNPERLMGMTEAEYNLRFRDPQTGLCLNGPYPSRGGYFLCEELSCNPADAAFDKLIALIERGERRTGQENLHAMLGEMESKEKSENQRRFDTMKEALPAFGMRAANLGGHVKKTKSTPVIKSANELGLPLKNGPRTLNRRTEYAL